MLLWNYFDMDYGDLSMNRLNNKSVLYFLMLLSISGGAKSVEYLNSYSNDRESHDASTATSSAVTVTCLNVTGSLPGGLPPACYILSPGYNQLLRIGQSIVTTGPGMVSLGCVGLRGVGSTHSCS